jgi:16S rRNA (guanine(966)-N(2))-methyltransferase RsmD
VRPTARRLREDIFELLGSRTDHARFLDLCSGSGAVGIEALSRGAAHATFVDRSAEMCSFVQANLELCGITDEQFEVVESNAADFARSAPLAEVASWDVVFFDPPYASDYLAIIELFASGSLLKPKGGVFIAEHHCENKLVDRISSLQRWRVIRQGESCLSFYERKK